MRLRIRTARDRERLLRFMEEEKAALAQAHSVPSELIATEKPSTRDLAEQAKRAGAEALGMDRKCSSERADFLGADRIRNAAREAEGTCGWCGRPLELHRDAGDCDGAADRQINL